MLNMVASGKVDNILKPTESKGLGNTLINNCCFSTTKLFRDIAWGTKGKWTKQEERKCGNHLCRRKAKDIIYNEWLGEYA